MGQTATVQSDTQNDGRYRAFFNHSVLAMAIADSNGRFLATNSRFAQLLDEEDLRPAVLADIAGSRQFASAEAPSVDFMAITFEKPLRRRDGTLIWLNVSVSFVPANPDSDSFVSVIIDDISERKRTDDALRQNERRSRALLELNNKIVSEPDVVQLFQTLAESLRSMVQYDSVGLALPNSQMVEMRIYSAQLAEGKRLVHERRVDLVEGSFTGRVFQTGKPMIFNGFPPWLNPQSRKLLETQGVQSGCVLPLLRRGNTLGVFSVASLKQNAFTESDLEHLSQIATQVAIAVENALRFHRLNESRKRLAGERLYLEYEIRRQGEFDEIVGESRVLKGVLEAVKTVAATDSAVLIMGETGTGKELIARAIHKLSPRRHHTLVRAECASIPAGLLESELFGHEKGAFTGAITRNIGRIELANKGTLFLDEVGDIPLELQSKLLRVLQEGEFERLGSTRTVRSDFRVVAATNRDLRKMVERAEFRRDLYYRLNVVPIRVPPLRERPEDIPLLTWHFVRKYARRMNKQIDRIESADMDALQRHTWPGNVRELQNVIERSVVESPGRVLVLAPLPETSSADERNMAHTTTLQEAERQHILQALRETDWVVSGPHGAAHRLGLRRTTLLYKMRRLGISRPTS
jgi:formate hydrogenlyase transcriptional activator